MQNRAYQTAAIDSVIDKWLQFDRVLGVAPTGSGKTIILSGITQRCQHDGRTLIMAHREELIDQAIVKLHKSTGIIADKEKAEHRARMSANVVVGSVQTLLARCTRFPSDHFKRIIVDETHHVLANSYQTVLNHFAGAKILGVTATADRSDKKNLGQYFEEVAFEISLLDLIKEGYLSKIVCKTVPLQIDLTKCRKVAGDFSADDVDKALAPWLGAVIDSIKEHASQRKILVFLPLVATSKEFVRLCNEAGIRAAHVDGDSPDRKEILSAYSRGEFQLLSNSMLLTEGYDEPSIDCVICLRPTQSRGLYSQIIGRGTRLSPGKENLLILDFLWQVEKHSLVKAAHLIAGSKEEADSMQAIIDSQLKPAGSNGELFDMDELLDLEEVQSEARTQREESLRKKLLAQAKRASRMIDPVEFGLNLHELSIAEYEPILKWHYKAVTPGQRASLEKAGIDVDAIQNAGHASVLLDALFTRQKMGLATAKQIAWLIKLGHPSPHTATFAEAGEFLDKKFNKGQQRKVA